jgi:hypothetical protein
MKAAASHALLPAIALCVVPAVAAVLGSLSCLLIVGQSASAAVGTLFAFLGWAIGVAVTIRWLGRRKAGPPLFRSGLLLAACISAGACLTTAGATARWQDFMSQPDPTPLMVLQDLTSAFLPPLAALASGWITLTLLLRRPSR